MGKYYVTIGLEMHCEGSKTNSKVFSSAKNEYTSTPNVNIRPLDMGFPGTLPVVNKEAVRMSLMMSSILHARIPEHMYFERKNYYYPDMPKNYQITQNPPYDTVGMGGYLDIIRNDGSTFRVEIDNFHLEEDAASMNHFVDISTIDYNRAGNPLFELVTKPCLHSADDAVSFLEYVRSIYQYCGISEADSKKGHIRCDVNVSISDDENTLGTKVETKNVNSFSGVHDCIVYEIERQTELKDAGRYDEVVQETRRWDEEKGETIHMRDKVDADDYKYFIDPNIPKIKISKEWVEEIRKSIPELPYERMEKYEKEYGLKAYDAKVLVKDKGVSDYFEDLVKMQIDPIEAANWMNSIILGTINKLEIPIEEFFIKAEDLGALIKLILDGKISRNQAKDAMYEAIDTNKMPIDIVKEKGLEQISDTGEIEKIVDDVLLNHEKEINDYLNGKTNAINFLLGQVMKNSRGKANPAKAMELLKEKIEERR